MRIALATLAVSIVASTSALAQPAPADPVIIVHGVPTHVRQFVSSVGAAPPAAGVLARWDAPLCAGVTGVDREVAQTMIDHIARRAHALGVRVGQSGCNANVMIIVTSESDRVAHDIYERRHTALISPNGMDSSTLGEAGLTDFVNTPRPVRWWQIAQTTMADGELLGDGRSSGFAQETTASAAAIGVGDPMTNNNGDRLSGMHATRSDGTRLRRSTRQDLSYMLIIVDTTRTNGASVGAVADYIAFVSLAQINPAPRTRDYPTILNLFEPDAQHVTAMSDLDLGYLDGLYHTTRNALSDRQQQTEIVRRMTGAGADRAAQ